MEGELENEEAGWRPAYQMPFKRTDNRAPDELRAIKITPGFLPNAEGSALIEIGNTRVICAASVED